MSDATRPRANPQLPLTRNHLYALGALSLALAVLSFFVGFQAGRGQVVAAPPPPVARLVPEEARTGDLEVLLAGVEQAHAPEAALAFPAELPRSTPPAAPATAGADATPATPAQAPFPLEARPGAGEVPGSAAVLPPTTDVPSSGWSIQVGELADEADAVRYMTTLHAAGLPAYRVVALVGGKTSWRVRVGGYSSKEAATAALSSVASKAGSATATVTPAP